MVKFPWDLYCWENKADKLESFDYIFVSYFFGVWFMMMSFEKQKNKI